MTEVMDMYDFYSHAPRGARLDTMWVKGKLTEISTHTPLAGRDLIDSHFHPFR